MIEILSFGIVWIVMFIISLMNMVHDNFYWTSYWNKDWPKLKRMSWKDYLICMWQKRIKTVCLAWRDLIPAVVNGIGLTLIFFGRWILGVSIIILAMILTLIIQKLWFNGEGYG